MHSRLLTHSLAAAIQPEATFYALLQNNHIIVIQAPAVVCVGYDYTADPLALEKADREVLYGLEIIQTLLPSLQFGLANWAYLLPRHDGGYRIQQQRKMVALAPTCQPWAPLVDESEIKITKWLTCGERQGIWNNRDVDLLVGWHKDSAKWVNDEMEGHRLLQGMNLTFDVLGHVVSNERIVGIMKEPAIGRLVEKSDRVIVYQAIARLQQRGLIFEAISASNIMITDDGNVRILSVQNVVAFQNENDKLETEAQRWHWDRLGRLFDILENHCNNMPVMRSLTSSNFKILPRLPSPERPFLSNTAAVLVKFMWHWQSSHNNNTFRTTYQFALTGLSTSGRRRLASSPRNNTACDTQSVESVDAPAWASHRATHRQSLNRSYWHPYVFSPRERRMLLGYQDSECSSDSEL